MLHSERQAVVPRPSPLWTRQAERDAPGSALGCFCDALRFRTVSEVASGALFLKSSTWCADLVRAQTNLIAQGVLVRGGISHGEVHHDGGVVFSPAFVRAYDLESQFANFPRIVLGPELFQGLRSDPRMRAEHHDLEDEIHYQSQLLRRGDDGFWFIDYLFAARHELDEPAEYPDLLVAHRDLVIKQALPAPASSRVLQSFSGWPATIIVSANASTSGTS